MKKKNIAKKAVLPALLAVLCSTAALTSVSYAWFTLGNEASVNNIDVNVQAADGLQVSADAAKWGSIISIDQLIDAGNLLGDEDTLLSPVSSHGTVTAGVQELFYAEKQTDGSLLGKAAVAGVDYLMFDLYVKVDSGKELSLMSSSSVTGKTGDDKDSELASRVSFVNLGNVPVDADYTADDATGLDISVVNTTAVIWEPNSTEHTAVASEAGAQGKVAYKGITSVADPEAGETLGAVTQASENTVTSDNTSDLKIATLEAGVNKLRIYIWLEGEDADCTNEISDSAFSVALKFSVPKAASENA